MDYSIGIDIGGTKIAGVLIDKEGKLIKEIYSPIKAGRKGIIKDIISIITDLKAKKVDGIGISAAGVADKNGKFIFSPNIKEMEGVNLREALQKRFKCKAYHENDANCFALAEYKLGAGRGCSNMAGIIIGTGIGSGLIVNDKLYKGSHGMAGELGHSIIDPSGPRCNCGNYGDFESLCSGPAIVKRYYAKAGKIDGANPEKIFYSKEKIARNVMEETCCYLGIGLSHLFNLLDLELIILGGGVSNLPFYKEINKEVAKNVHKGLKDKVNVVKNKLGANSGAIGAAMLVFDKSKTS